ncbi:MAG: hypothetical protein NTW12_05790, partial [Deltaproteobacteria bacterium]|nr:hypothetical protein [Deltaproteobacteria bacterium]
LHPFHYFGCQRAFSEPVALSQLHFRLGDWKYGLRFQNRRVTFYDVVIIESYTYYGQHFLKNNPSIPALVRCFTLGRPFDVFPQRQVLDSTLALLSKKVPVDPVPPK